MRSVDNMTTDNPKMILNKAARFATKAHAGQFRRDGVTSYCTHPLRVSNLLTFHGASDTEILCGLWHDILEDVPEKREDLMKELVSYELSARENFEIVSILEALNKPKDGNRKTRLKNFVKQIITCGQSAIMVKICDRIDNVMDSDGLEEFAEEYVVNETGYIVDEFLKLNLNARCKYALETLIEVRNEIINENEWV